MTASAFETRSLRGAPWQSNQEIIIDRIKQGAAPDGTVLFFDFDNTITDGDVLDKIIERFSVTERWREWESAWRQAEITTAQCLYLQIGDLKVSERELLRFVEDVRIDPYFPAIVEKCAAMRIPLLVVSDNFGLIVREILRRHSLGDVTVFANELVFDGDRPTAVFPHKSAQCVRCAHCKAIHFASFPAHRKVFVGDGLSDICPATSADLVFAKDALAAYLANVGISFAPLNTLEDVHDWLTSEARSRESAMSSAALD